MILNCFFIEILKGFCLMRSFKSGKAFLFHYGNKQKKAQFCNWTSFKKTIGIIDWDCLISHLPEK